MEIEEVTAAILINAKKAVANQMPAPSIVSNRAGNTVKISVSSEINPPASLKIATPRASATYMAGRIKNPANTAMPTSTRATCAPTLGTFSLSLR